MSAILHTGVLIVDVDSTRRPFDAQDVVLTYRTTALRGTSSAVIVEEAV